jgi:hypothetical protein
MPRSAGSQTVAGGSALALPPVVAAYAPAPATGSGCLPVQSGPGRPEETPIPHGACFPLLTRLPILTGTCSGCPGILIFHDVATMKSPPDLKLLAELKVQVRRAKRLSDVWTYFLDHFGENPAFIELGERTSSPMLEAILVEIGRALYHRDVKLIETLLTRLPEHDFIHGGCLLGGCLTNVIYFEDIQTGVLAVMPMRGKDMQFVRFSGHALPPNWKEQSVN